MEKIAAFGFWIFFLLIVVLPISLIIKLVLKSKKSSWSGEVIDKKHNVTEDMDDKTIESYYVVVKMDGGGRDRNIGLSPQMWKEFKVGDKIKKPAGKLYPEKV
ncbi:MAG: hypothetical protein PHX34_01075 [Candidatus Shapirobacteria bacterium]|nr:hypothetical protein [Candidatus Shapirobacteria bacterium]